MDNKQYPLKSPLIAVALMVKNESVSIESTLLSLAQGGIRHFFILDTGSSDNTIELAQSFFEQHKLHGYINQEAFVDFSTSRNRTLELAEQQFPHIPFLLMPDAEWYLQNGQELIIFCEQELYRETPLYMIHMKMNALEFAAARLFRASSRARFKGVVHEAPEAPAKIKVPYPIHFDVKTILLLAVYC